MTLLIRLLSTALLVSFASVSYAELKLNGVAVHNQLAQDQFIAAVYATEPTGDARSLLLNDADKAMEVRILTDTLYARRLKRMWIEGIAINAGAQELEQHAQHLADFSNLLRINLKAGDILRIERQTNTSTNLYLNGQALGNVPDDHFFDLLLRTWVGPVPLSSQFKDKILSGGNVNAELRSRLQQTSPSAERVAAVAAKLQNAEPEAAPIKEEESADRARQTAAAAATASQPAAAERVADRDEPPVKEPSASRESETEPDDTLAAEETDFAEEEEDVAVTAEDLLAEQVYISKLTKWTSSFVEYPRAALRKNMEGTVRVIVTVRRNGKLKDVQFLEKSEHEHLNRAAVKAARSASPYPAVPDTIDGDTFAFTVPLVFRLQ